MSNLTPLLVSLLRETRAHILSAPARYDQFDGATPTCGSPSCLVGWLSYLHCRRRHVGVPRDSRAHAINLFAAELGTTTPFATILVDQLFDVTQWPYQYYEEFMRGGRFGDRTMSAEEQARIAARRITHFIRHLA